jgi:hypothetical protein
MYYISACIKETVPRDFRLLVFFHESVSPKPLSIPLVNNTSGTGGKICRRCRWNRWCTLTCEYLREFPKKFEMTLTLFSGAWGKAIHEKNLKKKISWHCPFNRGKWEKCRQPDHIYIGPLLCTLRNVKQRILPFFNVRRSTKSSCKVPLWTF